MFTSKEFVAYFLNVAAEAEDSDEGMFARVAEVVPEELRAGIAKHAADEARHAVLLRECVVRNGGVPTPVSEDLRLFDRLLDAAGIDPAAQLMEFFLLLQVAEERAVLQYTAIASLLQGNDPESAAVLLSIAGDEAAHIVHCRVLATYFASDGESKDAALVRLREVEARVFAVFASAVFESAPRVGATLSE